MLSPLLHDTIERLVIEECRRLTRKHRRLSPAMRQFSAFPVRMSGTIADAASESVKTASERAAKMMAEQLYGIPPSPLLLASSTT